MFDKDIIDVIQRFVRSQKEGVQPEKEESKEIVEEKKNTLKRVVDSKKMK